MNVVDLTERRRAAGPAEPLRCACGGEWFELRVGERSGAVTIAQDGTITGYAGMPVCRDCGADRF